MKKKSMIFYLFTAMLPILSLADDATVLQNRLNQVNSFHANFVQRVSSAEGVAVQEGEGELWVKRPNFFNWHMTSPDESLMISDGKTLWFYNPFLEQVSANWLKTSVSNTPFMLITRNSASDWHQYNVTQKGDNFLMIPKFSNTNLKQFTIKVTDNGTIEGFTVIEENNHRSDYQLKNQNNAAVDTTKFHFTPPQGVTLDDQRMK